MTSRLGTLISKSFLQRRKIFIIQYTLAASWRMPRICAAYSTAKDRTDFGQMGTEDIIIWQKIVLQSCLTILVTFTHRGPTVRGSVYPGHLFWRIDPGNISSMHSWCKASMVFIMEGAWLVATWILYVVYPVLHGRMIKAQLSFL